MRDKKSVFIFFAVNVIFSMAASSAHPVTPTIIQERNFGDYMFGVALASQMAVNFLFSPFWGKLVNYLGSRRILLISCLGYSGGQFLFWMAPTEGMLVGARMFAGVFVGGAFTTLLTYIINTSPQKMRGNYLTILATIQTVASAFGYFMGGMLGEISTNVTMATQVFLIAACGVIFYFICEDDAEMKLHEIEMKTIVKEANPVAAFLAGGKIMTPILISVFAVAALANLGNNAFDQSFNYYLKEQLGLTSGYNGAIKAVIGVISLLANSLVGMWLINKTDIRRSIIHVYLACAAATLSVVLIEGTIPFVIANIVYFGFFAISVPLTQNLAADRAKGRDSNLVMGFYNGLKSLGGIFGALAAGLLYTVDPKWPFVLGFAAFALATLLCVKHYKLCLQEDSTVVRDARLHA